MRLISSVVLSALGGGVAGFMYVWRQEYNENLRSVRTELETRRNSIAKLEARVGAMEYQKLQEQKRQMEWIRELTSLFN